MAEWGRKEYSKKWPSRTPVWTWMAILLTMVFLAGMLTLEYERSWTEAERLYLSDYLKSGARGKASATASSKLCLAKMPSGQQMRWFWFATASCALGFDQEETIRRDGAARASAQIRAAERYRRTSPPSLIPRLSAIGRSQSSCGEIITVMQAAEPGHGYDIATSIGRCRQPFRRSCLLQREMRSVLVVVVHVFGHKPF